MLFSIVALVSANSNFILILTDDQDVVLNGLNPMENVQKLLANEGAVFTNAVSRISRCLNRFMVID